MVNVYVVTAVTHPCRDEEKALGYALGNVWAGESLAFR